jgi:hypothetical protein
VVATKYMLRERIGGKPAPKGQWIESPSRVAARSLSHYFSRNLRHRMGGAIRSPELRSEVGTGRRKYRFRVDTNLRPGLADQETN